MITTNFSPASAGGGGGGGITPDDDISIAASLTTTHQYDSIRFLPTNFVNFSTPESHAASGNIYLPRMHDILYLWDFKKTGNWKNVSKLHTAHMARRYQQGPIGAAVFDATGDYEVHLIAIELSTGKVAQGYQTISITSVDDEYPGTQTIAIVSNGGSQVGIPAGAQVYELAAGNVFDHTHVAWTSNRGGLKKRFLFEGGAQFDVRISDQASNVTDGIMFSSYGTGYPVFYRTGSETVFDFGAWTEVSTGVPKRIFINKLRVTGNFDPSTHTGNQSDLIGIGGGCKLVVSDVQVEGLGGNVFIVIGNASLNTYFHLDDTSVKKIGGQYPVYTDTFTHPDNTCAITGCSVERDPQSNYDEGFSGLDGSQRAPFRLNGHAYCAFTQSYVFQNTGDQPCVKLGERGDVDGGVYSMHGNVLECSIGMPIRYKFNASDHARANLILRQNVLISGHSTTTFGMTARGQGNSCDVNLHIAPSTAGSKIEGTRSTFNFDGPSGGHSAVCPNKARNNTSVLLKPTAENAGISVFETNVNQNASPVTELNDNVVETVSGGGNDTGDGPLNDADFFVAVSNTGRFEASVFDTSWATSPTQMATFRPLSGSTAISGGSANAFPIGLDTVDLSGVRFTNKNRGCWN